MQVATDVHEKTKTNIGTRVALQYKFTKEGVEHEPMGLASGHIFDGTERSGCLLLVFGRLREDLGASGMIYVTAIVATFTFGYLLTAMIRPEWF
jgi:hypothetical protein